MKKKSEENKIWTFIIFLLGFANSAYLVFLEFSKAFLDNSIGHLFLGYFFCLSTILFLVIGLNRWKGNL